MRVFRRTTLITAGCLAALAGIGLSREVGFNYSDWLVLFLPLLLILKKKNLSSLTLVVLLGLLLGLWRGSLYMQKLNDLKSLTTRSVTIQATATSDAVYVKGSQLQFTANHIQLITPHHQLLAGNFKISGFGVHMVYRGEIVKVQGAVYPTRGAKQATIAYAQLSLVQSSHSWFNDLSRRFATGMQNALPEPMASFGMGLLIGQRINMPASVTAQLTAVGLVHIVAVSGYNLTILIRAIQRVRLRSKYQQLMASLLLIGLFITITGFSASIVRAALVSSLSLWAWYYGRQIKPMVLISFAATLTGLANPFYIWGDLSWYLSFLAFFGVMIIAPIIQGRFFKRTPKFLTIVLLETLSAELMTLPIVMLTFSQLSIIAIIANLLVVPLVPAAMLLSALAGAGGALVPELAGWLAWPANLLLTYMLDVIHLLASIPSVLIKASISATYMLSFYAVLLAVVGVAYEKSKDKNLETAP
jgi:competence protein ComEC